MMEIAKVPFQQIKLRALFYFEKGEDEVSEKKQVLKVTLMRTDLSDDPSYAGASLRLPTNNSEIKDAFHRARIINNEPYQIVECVHMNGQGLDFNLCSSGLEELNFLALRLSEMSEYDSIAFQGFTLMWDREPTIQDFINITYNLDNVHVILAQNDRELGKFYVDNDFIEAVNHLPSEYQKDLLEMLDYEKIGYDRRTQERGIFVGNYYVVYDPAHWNPVYDGVHHSEILKDPPCVFKLQLVKLDSNATSLPESESGVPLLLPATEQDILKALDQLSAPTLDECIILHYESSIPSLEQAFSFSEDIDKLNLLAERIREMEAAGELPKFKAALELADCTDIDQVLDLTQNLGSYDFYPELSSPEDYVRQEFMERYQIPQNDPVLKCIRITGYDFSMMQNAHIIPTAYGIISRNKKEMNLDYSSPQTGQQML